MLLADQISDSVLDAIMDIPMAQVIESLCLTPDLTEALENKTGKLGLVLSGVVAAEGGNWDHVLQFGVRPDVWRNIYFESMRYSNVLMNEVYAEQ